MNISSTLSPLLSCGIISTLLLTGCHSLLEPQFTESPQSPRIAAASVGICDAQFNEAALTGWTKTFEDNFDDPTLGKWNVWTGGAFNNELQNYQRTNINFSSGVMTITAKRETVTGPSTIYDATPKTFDFTSGRIESKTNFTPNRTNGRVRMVARIKLPYGYGMWPAFWSYGDNWPTNGEIDILEGKGNEPNTYHTNYFYGRRANMNLVTGAEKTIVSDVSLVNCWHVYELIWVKDSLTFLLDGQVVDVKTGGYIPNLFGKLQRITLNLAVGGDYFGNPPASSIEPGVMSVDWVKVFVAK